jgi:hypothetical protein
MIDADSFAVMADVLGRAAGCPTAFLQTRASTIEPPAEARRRRVF